MKNRLAMVLCLLVCLAGTTDAQRAPRKRPTSAPPPEQLVKQTVERLNQAWATNNPDGINRTCAEDVVMTESGKRLRGVQALLDYAKFSAQNFPSTEITLSKIEARVLGSMAWAHADHRMVLSTPRGSKLAYTGYSSYVLERQRAGWKVVLMDLDLERAEKDAVPGSSPTSPSSSSAPTPTLEGAWRLDSSVNLRSGQELSQVALVVFTKTYYSLVATASNRQPPKEKDKKLSDYSRKELQELLREFDPNAGAYRLEENKLILSPALALLPGYVGQDVTLENVKLTRDQLSYEVTTPDGRLRRVWRRIE